MALDLGSESVDLIYFLCQEMQIRVQVSKTKFPRISNLELSWINGSRTNVSDPDSLNPNPDPGCC
jgi:hypothetical protein